MKTPEHPPPWQGVIFDMDGTVIEPLLDFAAMRKHLGIRPEDGIIESIDAMPPDNKAEATAWLEACELSAANQSQLTPGAVEAVAAIRNAGIRTALLTRNTAESMKTVLARHPELAFDLTMTREDGPIKPEPDGILRACRELGIPPVRTLCVGDFLYDILAAHAAGCTAVLLAPADPPDFADQADHVIGMLHELPALLGI